MIISTSCIHDENIFGCRGEIVSAAKELSITGNRVYIDSNRIMGAYDIYAYDSVLVVKTPSRSSKHNIHLFNMNDGRFLGDYITVGRGPGELLSPSIVCKHPAGNEHGIYIFDTNTDYAYVFMPDASINNGVTELRTLAHFKKRVLYAYPYQDSLHLTLFPDPKYYMLQVVNDSGEARQESIIYNVSGMRFFDKLSSCNAVNPETGVLAMAMCMLPQINFMDMKSGNRKMVAINKKFRDWKSILNTEVIDGTNYYSSVDATSRHLYALYLATPYKNKFDGNFSAHIHIFDWDGNFLADLSVPEELIQICYSTFSDALYGLDKEEHIFRYDLSSIDLN